MTQPEAQPAHDPSHTHVDMDALTDASEQGAPDGDDRSEIDTSAGVGGDGEEVDRSGESSDAYMSGQDGGSMD